MGIKRVQQEPHSSVPTFAMIVIYKWNSEVHVRCVIKRNIFVRKRIRTQPFEVNPTKFYKWGPWWLTFTIKLNLCRITKSYWLMFHITRSITANWVSWRLPRLFCCVYPLTSFTWILSHSHFHTHTRPCLGRCVFTRWGGCEGLARWRV